ncbi:MAG: hypothetical protein JWO82_2184 [Akkermansiaceae bacterium]|nr:hypothetical protein [Akkermansiaceae bacterium]
MLSTHMTRPAKTAKKTAPPPAAPVPPTRSVEPPTRHLGPPTRHMQRADGKAQTSISMREDLLDQARRAAEAEGRSLSNWIEQMLKERFTPGSDPAASAADAGPAPRSATPPPKSAPRGRKKA